MSREEELAKLKQQAAEFQSQGVGGPSRAAGPLSARLQLTESDSEFMRQLAQLKEDHVANLRVIERMYNEGQGGGGSALPDYDDGHAERTDDALLRAPLDAAFEARVAEQERRAAAARSQAGAAATHDGAPPRPNFARPLDAGLPDDEYPPPPPPPQDLPLASTSRAHLPPRPASAGPSRSRSLGDRHGQSRAAYQPTVPADGEADAGAPADGLSQRLAASSSMDDLNPRDDGRREYDPLAAAAAVRRRPASAPRERPRGITIPRPFNFDSRPPRESTSMRRLRLELQERDAQLREGRNSVRHVPLPPSTKEPRYEQICAEAAARVKARREGRKAEMLASAKPFSFHKPVEKKPPPPEPDLQVTFRATPVPPAVHEPLWEIIQHREAGRQERVAREAQALYQKRQLSNKDSKREEERQARRAEAMARIEAEVHKDHTFHPKVRASLPPDFQALQRRFERSLQAAKESNPHRKVKHEEFALRTDQLRGGHHRPAPEQIAMVEADIARDNLVLPEERWPKVSTRAKVPPRAAPDFKALHKDPRMPMYRSTTSAELRKACVEEAELKHQLRARREEQKEAKRLAALREVSKEVARAMGNGSAKLNKLKQQQAEKTLRERFKADAREKQQQADARLAEIRAKVADRPFLFQRQSADANALRAKQAQYDKFGAVIREHGLGDLLEKMPYS